MGCATRWWASYGVHGLSAGSTGRRACITLDSAGGQAYGLKQHRWVDIRPRTALEGGCPPSSGARGCLCDILWRTAQHPAPVFVGPRVTRAGVFGREGGWPWSLKLRGESSSSTGKRAYSHEQCSRVVIHPRAMFVAVCAPSCGAQRTRVVIDPATARSSAGGPSSDVGGWSSASRAGGRGASSCAGSPQAARANGHTATNSAREWLSTRERCSWPFVGPRSARAW